MIAFLSSENCTAPDGLAVISSGLTRPAQTFFKAPENSKFGATESDATWQLRSELRHAVVLTNALAKSVSLCNTGVTEMSNVKPLCKTLNVLGDADLPGPL
jgi:hypothetical protein